MVVDDDEDGRFLFGHRLRKSMKDCVVVACSSAKEALPLLENGEIDAIVSDHQLGEESGCAFIGEARQRGVGCPIVVVTGNEDPAVERNAYAAGATKVFQGGRGDFAEYLRLLLLPNA